MCEFERQCKRHVVLKYIQDKNGFTADIYPLTELKKDVCDNCMPQAREQCPAFIDFSKNGRASQWAR